MTTALFRDLDRRIREKLPHIRSILVFQGGQCLWEQYYRGSYADDPQPIASITKSFTATLVGIALGAGILHDLDQRVLDFFPEHQARQSDERASQITLRHLLTMTGGFAWIDDDFAHWLESPDWMAFALGLPLATAPGEQFNYSTPGAHLLSGVLAKATQMTTLDFAQLTLFDPLGIQRPTWDTDPQGYVTGGHGLAMRPRDLVKLGLLFLHSGQWQGRQVVPPGWVKASTEARNPGGEPEECAYGYLWWITAETGFTAYFGAGFGGQYLYVVPALDVVLVIASDLDEPHLENRSLIRQVVSRLD